MKSVVLATNTPPQTQAIVSQVLLLCFHEITVQKEAHSLLWLLFQNDCFAAICSTGSVDLPCFSLCVRHVRSEKNMQVKAETISQTSGGGVGEILKNNTKKNSYVL